MNAEQELIDKVLTTPYEKVLKKLNDIKSLLLSLESQIKSSSIEKGVNDIEWVMNQIKSHNLYSYAVNIDKEKLATISNSNLQCLIDYLKNNVYSRNSFIRSEAYMKIRRGIGLSYFKEKKYSFKANEAQMKQIRKLRNEHFVSQIEKQRAWSNEGKKENDEMIENMVQAKTFERRKRLLSNGTEQNGTQFKQYLDVMSVKKKENIKSNLSENNYNHHSPSQSSHKNLININDIDNITRVNFNDLSSISFNIFAFKSKYGYINVLPLIGKFLFQKYSLEQYIISDKLYNFLASISSGYFESTLYHNAIHGADVAQTLSTFFLHSDLVDELKLTKMDLISTFTAALSHDLGHPGRNNNFQINAFTELALMYNDVSVLENYHCSLLFKILKNENLNIFSNYSTLDFRKMRKRVIGMILSTDMFNHGKVFGKTRSKMIQNNYVISIDSKKEENLFSEQQEYLECLLHIADISHNAKSFEMTTKWVDLLTEEMLGQGDKEKELGMTISFLCDRTKVDLPKSQIGFINAFIIPSFELLDGLTKKKLEIYLRNVKENLKMWEEKNHKNINVN